MGLMICGSWPAIILGAGAGYAVFRICKRLGRPEIGQKYGVMTFLIWVVMWLGPSLYFAQWLTTTVEIGIAGPKADALLARFKVPPGKASDVCFRSSYQRTYAD